MVKLVKKTVSAAIFFLLACLCVFSVFAEEAKHGEYIYVPAAVSAPEGFYSLRAEVNPLSEAGEQTAPQNLAGAVFGIYVISEDGEPVPWANPLYLWEPMRLRTGEKPVRFSLPAGMDFYLRQESAPDGILFDSAEWIPIDREEIVVRNQAYGELVISARDSQGKPLPGAEFSVKTQENTTQILTADATGTARLRDRKSVV